MDVTPNSSSEKLLDEAEALIWNLLDDKIEPADAKRLEALLQENEQVRQRYLSCVQMHNDLHQHFDALPASPPVDGLPQSPVLGSLDNLQPGTVSLPPVAE